MKFLPFLLLAFVHCLPVNAQSKLLLENRRTGRQKEIKPGSRIRIRFVTQYEGLKVRQQGRVLSLTDSTLTYATPLPKDTVTVALSQITNLGKYNGLGTVALAVGAGTAAGITAGLMERDLGPERRRPSVTLLSLLGAILLYNGLDAVVYPVRRVKDTNAAWHLRIVR